MIKKPPISHKIGSILALLQVFIDNVFAFWFKKLKTFGQKKQSIENPQTFKDKTTEFVHKSARFIGDVGSSYYEEYQKLKANKKI